MVPPEHRAVLLLLSLAVAGQGVRHLAAGRGDPPGQVQLLSVLPAGSASAHRDSAMRQARPLQQNEQIDADLAPATELARLPRVGLALAKTIVADRDAHGPFRNLAGFDRVPGIGPGLLRTLAPHLTFSGAKDSPAFGTASDAGVGTAFASRPGAEAVVTEAASPGVALNLNRATALELDGLPGIGPALARRIVADRDARGPFATVATLDRVPGIGPALVARLGGLVTAP